MKNRTLWIDIAKGITIILMVIGHTSIPMSVSNFIWSFHMPLFFIASGWCTHWEKYTFNEFLFRRCKSLLLPFIFYSIIVIAVSCIIENPMFSLTEGWKGYALWFVPVLFMASLMAKMIMSIPYKTFRISAAWGCFLLGAVLGHYRIVLPWTLSTVPFAIFLVLTGSYLSRYEKVISNPKWWIMLGGFVIVALISHFWRLDLAWNVVNPVIPLTIGALVGTAMLATAASYIAKGPSWIYHPFFVVGKETFAIMAFSQITIVSLNKYFVLNPLLKYMLLIVILAAAIILKNLINKVVNIDR